MSIDIVGVLKLITICVVSYISIVLVLRISGKRTLSKMNAFDFIITVALGSVLATTIVSYQDSFWNGILTFVTLVVLQYVATWLSVRFKFARTILKSRPSLLYFEGDFDEEALIKERITKGELKQAIRTSGFISFEQVAAIVLESDGTLSVMETTDKIKLEKDDFLVKKSTNMN